MIRKSIRTSAEEACSRSGGPGGQNVNKVNTRVTLRLPLAAIEGLSEPELARLRETLAGRITKEGEIIVHSSGERSRRRNQEDAWDRLEALILSAAQLPKKRRPSKPDRALREARLREKRRRSEIKQNRRSFQQFPF